MYNLNCKDCFSFFALTLLVPFHSMLSNRDRSSFSSAKLVSASQTSKRLSGILSLISSNSFEFEILTKSILIIKLLWNRVSCFISIASVHIDKMTISAIPVPNGNVDINWLYSKVLPQ